MSTKTEQTTENIYNKGSMAVYDKFQPTVQNVLLDAMQNPFKSNYFTQQVQMMQKQNQGLLSTAMGNVINNLKMRGIDSSSPLAQSMIARQQRASSANANNAFLQALMNARNTQLQATGMAQSYQPLQTGTKQTVQKKGLGTWLPQAISMAMGVAQAAMGNPEGLMQAAGGASGLAGGGGGGGFSMSDGGGGMGVGSGLNMGGSGGYFNPLLTNPFSQFSGKR